MVGHKSVSRSPLLFDATLQLLAGAGAGASAAGGGACVALAARRRAGWGVALAFLALGLAARLPRRWAGLEALRPFFAFALEDRLRLERRACGRIESSWMTCPKQTHVCSLNRVPWNIGDDRYNQSMPVFCCPQMLHVLYSGMAVHVVAAKKAKPAFVVTLTFLPPALLERSFLDRLEDLALLFLFFLDAALFPPFLLRERPPFLALLERPFLPWLLERPFLPPLLLLERLEDLALLFLFFLDAALFPPFLLRERPPFLALLERPFLPWLLERPFLPPLLLLERLRLEALALLFLFLFFLALQWNSSNAPLCLQPVFLTHNLFLFSMHQMRKHIELCDSSTNTCSRAEFELVLCRKIGLVNPGQNQMINVGLIENDVKDKTNMSEARFQIEGVRIERDCTKRFWWDSPAPRALCPLGRRALGRGALLALRRGATGTRPGAAWALLQKATKDETAWLLKQKQ